MSDIDEVIRERALAKQNGGNDYNNRFESFKAHMRADGQSGARSVVNLKAGNMRTNGKSTNQKGPRKVFDYGNQEDNYSNGFERDDKSMQRPQSNNQSAHTSKSNIVFKYSRGGLDNFAGTGQAQIKAIKSEFGGDTATGLKRPYDKK